MFPLIPFIPGTPQARLTPLARYLPPIEAGVALRWLAGVFPDQTVQPAGGGPAPWVLDPFGAAPAVTVEAARAGFRVLVAANNPVARFLLELAADPPQKEELNAALAELASLRRGDERVELHLRNLYLTHCDNCGAEVMAEAFLWERSGGAAGAGSTADEGPHIFARIYHCPVCGESGEHPAMPEDIERALQFSTGGLHRARALERVAGRDDPDRRHVEEALAAYLPRAVYALFTLVNKLESLPPTHPDGARRAVDALLLSAFDAANTLWPYPTGRARPRQLSIPPRFREKNVWLALEEAVDAWTGADLQPPVVVTNWPELPPETGGICVFEGRLKDLAGQVYPAAQPQIQVQANLAALPRPNQAFWTLSALWAGWLWGREAVGPFKSVLRRRRYDWGWHTTALEAALEHLSPLVAPGTRFLGLVGEAEPGFLSAALIAGEAAGFQLTGLAQRPEEGQAQIHWELAPGIEHASTGPSPAGLSATPAFIARAALQYLEARGEPAHYSDLHAAGIATLIQAGGLDLAPAPAERLSRLNDAFEEAFSYRHGFLRYGGSQKSTEAGWWWLRESPEDQPERASPVPLADRVEMAVVKRLLEQPAQADIEIDAALCAQFPGLFTPEAELVRICLDSYAEQTTEKLWRLRDHEAPIARRQDLKTISGLLQKVAEQLGLTATGQSPHLWLDPNGEVRFALYLVASAVVGRLILDNPHPAESSLILLPEGRARLLAYKLSHDPRLSQRVGEGWRFLSFHQIYWLSEQETLNQRLFTEQLTHDLTEFATPQMRLL